MSLPSDGRLHVPVVWCFSDQQVALAARNGSHCGDLNNRSDDRGRWPHWRCIATVSQATRPETVMYFRSSSGSGDGISLLVLFVMMNLQLGLDHHPPIAFNIPFVALCAGASTATTMR
jgi:hypothetical protein